jgi:hypothetical protein
VVRTVRASTSGYSLLPTRSAHGHARSAEGFAATGENPINYIVRHMNLDPGLLAAEDQLANLQAVREGTRVFSAYELRDGTRISDRH